MNIILNRRLPLAPQVPKGWVIHWRGRQAIARPRVMPGFPAKFNRQEGQQWTN